MGWNQHLHALTAWREAEDEPEENDGAGNPLVRAVLLLVDDSPNHQHRNHLGTLRKALCGAWRARQLQFVPGRVGSSLRDVFERLVLRGCAQEVEKRDGAIPAQHKRSSVSPGPSSASEERNAREQRTRRAQALPDRNHAIRLAGEDQKRGRDAEDAVEEDQERRRREARSVRACVDQHPNRSAVDLGRYKRTQLTIVPPHDRLLQDSVRRVGRDQACRVQRQGERRRHRSVWCSRPAPVASLIRMDRLAVVPPLLARA